MGNHWGLKSLDQDKEERDLFSLVAPSLPLYNKVYDSVDQCGSTLDTQCSTTAMQGNALALVYRRY